MCLWALGSHSSFSNFCFVFMLYCQPRAKKLAVDTVRQPRNMETPANVLVLDERSCVSFSFFKVIFHKLYHGDWMSRFKIRAYASVALFAREETPAIARRAPRQSASWPVVQTVTNKAAASAGRARSSAACVGTLIRSQKSTNWHRAWPWPENVGLRNQEPTRERKPAPCVGILLVGKCRAAKPKAHAAASKDFEAHCTHPIRNS